VRTTVGIAAQLTARWGRGTWCIWPESESCTPPLEVQVASICDRNALVLDVRPRATFHARGVSVLDYGERRLELASAASQIMVFAAPDRARRAIAALRPIDEEAPRGDLPCALEPTTR
jgi:hypothetical protein